MNEPLEPENRLAHDLSQMRLAPPSADLREQVLDAARKAWDDTTTSAELPWRLPVLRLAGCVAAATLLIVLANLTDRYSATNRQLRTLRVTHTVTDLEQNAYPQLSAWPADRPYRSRRGASQDVVQHVHRMERLLRGVTDWEANCTTDSSPHTWLRRETPEPRIIVKSTSISSKQGRV
jgi:hypothetical protein